MLLLTIDLTSSDVIAICAIAASVALAIGGGLIFLIFRSGRVYQKIEGIETYSINLNTELRAIKTRVDRVPHLERSIDTLWQHNFATRNSPLQLNEKGIEVLEKSTIKQIVDSKFDKIIELVKEKSPQNSYEVQEYTKEAVETISNDDETKNLIENAAFNSGFPINIIIFVGSIYVRDRVISELGFNIVDIDKFEAKPPLK